MNETMIYQEVSTSFAAIDFSRLYGKSLLVTGATGLVGSYLMETVRWLNTEKNADIQLYVVSHSGLPAHLCAFENDPHTTILSADLTDVASMESFPTVDFVIHAAGYAQPAKFTQNPDKTLRLNTTATFQLLEKVEKDGSFLFVSTSEVYSGLEKDRYTEQDIGTTTPQHPRACYIEGKRCGEAFCMAARTKGVDAKCARLSLAYGPGTRADDRRVLSEFIRKALLNGQIGLMDSGSALRTYCYVTDAVEQMWQILLHGTQSVYNVGGHSSISIAGLARMVGEALNVPVVIPPEDSSMGGAPKSVQLELNRVEEEFCKHDYVSMEDGLARTIAWQKDNLYSAKMS